MTIYFDKANFELSTAENYIEIKGVDINVKPFNFEPCNLMYARNNIDREVKEYKDYLDSINDTCWIDFDNGESDLDDIREELKLHFPKFTIETVWGVFEHFYSDFVGDGYLDDALLIAYEFKDDDEELISKCANYLDALYKKINSYSTKDELVADATEHFIGCYESYEELFDDILDEYDVLGSHASIIREHVGWNDDEFYKEIYEAEEGCDLYEENGYYYYD